MPDPAPPGVLPMFIRGVTAEKYGFKTGEGIQDLVDSLLVPKSKIMDEITVLGVMSDFEPAKKQLEAYPADEVLFVIDKGQQYGEMFLLCYTLAAREVFESKVREAAEAIEAQKRAEIEAEEARIAAEFARLNVVYEDKPVEARPWKTESSADTEEQVKMISSKSVYREPVCLEITRPKRQIGVKLHLYDRDAEVSGIAEWRAVKDPNFKQIVESDTGFQAAPRTANVTAQTTWNRTVNKSIQYEAISIGPEGGTTTETYNKELLLEFLEKATVAVEKALQQNESVDIFNETFQIVGEESGTGAAADSELKELKNFADPQYSKSKSIVAIDWLPKSQGFVTVSVVRNMSFDQRAAVAGQTNTSHLLIWDFRQLVKPAAVLKCNHEILSFRFNPNNQNLVIGGCITGQVALWDISAVLASQQKKNRNNQEDDNDDKKSAPIGPILTSSIDHSHKKPVAEIMWLPANTQINHRGQLVASEHLDGQQYQFVTISGDGIVLVWDTRYEQIAADELKHIGRAKHVPVEKSGSKGDEPKLLWAPIFRAPLKRSEGIGELSLNKLQCAGLLPSKLLSAGGSQLPGDSRSHLVLTTEEGEVMFVDLCVAPTGGQGHSHEEEDEGKEVVAHRDFVRWMLPDHTRPSVAIQLSPFFTDIVLTVSDWAFHIWKVGNDKPIYVSPNHEHYLTCGCWSPTRPAVVILTDHTGHLQIWDFTDTSTRPSAELKATHARITSMEFMGGAAENANTNQQLLAIGDEQGTLHVFEMPRNLIRPVPKEKSLMAAFMAREWERIEYVRHIPAIEGFTANVGSAPLSVVEVDIGIDEDAEAVPATAATGPPTASASATLVGTGTLDNDLSGGADDSLAAARRAMREALKKEEEAFLKMEALFVSDLDLKASDIPDSIRSTMLQLSDKEKEKLTKEKRV
jgi:WD40 repeat protein